MTNEQDTTPQESANEVAEEATKESTSPQDDAPQGRIEGGEESVPRDRPGVGDNIERATHELHMDLPGGNVALPIKVIALITLLGGSSVLGATFVDLFNPGGIPFGLALVRIIAGFVLILISYGLVKRQRWAIWLYAFVVLGGTFINWSIALLLFILVLYLYWQRNYFAPSGIDEAISKGWASLRR